MDWRHIMSMRVIFLLPIPFSVDLYNVSMPDNVFPQEVPSRVPKNVTEALSPAFVDEWGPAIECENAGFQKYHYF